MRGFFGIGVWHPQHDCNVGTLFRSAYAFEASFLFTIGRKYRHQASDTCNSPMHIPYYNYLTYEEFNRHRPYNARLVMVEISEDAYSLPSFVHPERAIYIIGSEGGGLPPTLLKENLVVSIPTKICLNLATAGSIVLYDRCSKGVKNVG